MPCGGATQATHFCRTHQKLILKKNEYDTLTNHEFWLAKLI